MCSAVGRTAVVASVVASSLMVGCGQPRGVVFPTIDPPRVWPAAPDQPRIRLVGQLTGSGDLRASESTGEVLQAVFRGPRPPIRFSGPHGIAISATGRVAVADASGGSVHIVELDERTHHLVTGFDTERFATPVGVAWAGERLFVTDAKRHEVVELGADGSYRQRFGSENLRRPVGIVYVQSRDRLYVVDGDAHAVCVFEPSGRLASSFGKRGSEPGAFNFPTHIGCSGDRLVVADSGNFRVQVLDLDGHVVGSIGKKGDGAGDLSLPKGVAFDSDGHVYVVDAHFENVQVFDTNGRLLMAFGTEGNDMGQFVLPAGLAIDREDRIWVADSGNRRLQVFAYMRASS